MQEAVCNAENSASMEFITQRHIAGNLSNEIGITSIVVSRDATEHGNRQTRPRSYLKRKPKTTIFMPKLHKHKPEKGDKSLSLKIF